MQKNKILKKGYVVGIIILLIGISIIPEISSKINSTINAEKTLDAPLISKDQDTSSITLRAFGGTWKKENNVVLPSDDANAIYNIFEKLIYEMTHNSCNDKTYFLKNEFIGLLDENGLLQEGISKDEFLSLLNPSWLKSIQNNRFYSLYNKLKQTLKNPLFNRVIKIFENMFFNFDSSSKSLGVSATATICTIASYGEGLTLPIFIPPRPRIVISWYATLAETYVGEIFTNKGFYANGGQTGTAWGFTGGGLTFALPWGNMYAFIGYAGYTKVKADNMEFYPPNQPPVITNENPPSGTENIPLSLSELSFWISDPDDDLMDYTVTTEPYIGSGSGNNKDNGVYIVPISGLEYDKMYTWTVKLTDGNFVVEQDFSFFTVSGPPFDPFDEGWQYRKKITINHNMVDGNHIDFPVLISVVDNDLKNKAQGDGDDILLMDSSGVANKLYHEIEKYDESNGELVAWIRIPSLSSSVDTILYMYYGNSDCSAQQLPQKVWDSNFLCIHHLNGANADVLDDSTHNSNDVMGHGGTPLHEQTGQIGNCVYIDDNEGYYLKNFAKLNNNGNRITVEAWVKRGIIGDFTVIVAKYDNVDGSPPPAEWFFRFLDTNTLQWQIRYSDAPQLNNYITSTTYTDTSDFHYYAVVHKVGDGTKTQIYYDGNEDTTGSWVNGDGNLIPNDVNYVVSFGNLYYKSNWNKQALHGYLDEVRISNIIRTPDWLKTTYNTINNPSSFLSFGPEEP